MIGFVDRMPTIEPHDGGFLLTFTSGGAAAQFFLTRHAMFCTQARIGKAVAQAAVAELEAEPIPLPKRKRR